MPRRRKYKTNADRQKAYRRRKRLPVYLRHKSAEWETPSDLFETLNREFGFTLDVCATPTNKKCENFFSPEQDGLAQEWIGACWCNPPYGYRLEKWIQKAYESSQRGAIVVCLLPGRTDTRWWHEWILPYAEIRFLRGRLKLWCLQSRAFPKRDRHFQEDFPAATCSIRRCCMASPDSSERRTAASVSRAYTSVDVELRCPRLCPIVCSGFPAIA